MIAAETIREALAGAGRLGEGARALGWPGALALGGPGLWLLLDGARRRRPIAALAGGAAGALAGAWLSGWAEARLGISRPLLVGGAALAVGGAAAAFPLLFAFAVGALPGALLGSLLPIGRSELAGAAAGALASGVTAVLLAGPVAAAASASLGAALLCGAALAGLGPRPLAAELASRPRVLLGLAAVLSVAGAAFQAGRAWEAPGARPAAREEDLDATRIA
jgi:hypothetical protein